MEPANFAELVPTEYRADQVVMLMDRAATPTLGIVVEVQLNQDGAKRYSWPA